MKYGDIVIITAFTCIQGVWYDSQPLEYTPDVKKEYEKMVRNYQKGLVPNEPEIIKYQDYYINNPVLY